MEIVTGSKLEHDYHSMVSLSSAETEMCYWYNEDLRSDIDIVSAIKVILREAWRVQLLRLLSAYVERSPLLQAETQTFVSCFGCKEIESYETGITTTNS